MEDDWSLFFNLTSYNHINKQEPKKLILKCLISRQTHNSGPLDHHSWFNDRNQGTREHTIESKNRYYNIKFNERLRVYNKILKIQALDFIYTLTPRSLVLYQWRIIIQSRRVEKHWINHQTLPQSPSSWVEMNVHGISTDASKIVPQRLPWRSWTVVSLESYLDCWRRLT